MYGLNLQVGAGQGLTYAELASIKAKGFDTVRMPFYWGFFQPVDQNTVTESAFTSPITPAGSAPSLDQVVQWCVDLGLNLILLLAWTDSYLPPAWGFQGITTEAGRWERILTPNSIEQIGFTNTWKAIAQRYSGTINVMMELFNEPYVSTLGNNIELYSAFAEHVIDEIETVETVGHLKIIETLWVAGILFEEVANQQRDVLRNNTCWALHMYLPMGAYDPTALEWMMDYATGVAHWMTVEYEILNRLKRCTDKFASWGKQWIMTEFGKLKTDTNWQAYIDYLCKLMSVPSFYPQGLSAKGWIFHGYDKFDLTGYSVTNTVAGDFDPAVMTILTPYMQQPEPPPPVPYYLSISASAGGITDPPVGTHPYAVNSIVQVTAIPQGSSFIKWTLDGVDQTGNPITVSMNSNHAVHATFSEPTPVYYNLTIPSVTGCTTNPPAGIHSYLSGASVYATCAVNNGYVFDHWDLDGNNVGLELAVTIYMTKNQMLTPILTQIVNYTLTAGNNITLNPLGGVYPSGTVVQATANPPNGYTFAYWLLDNVNAGSSNPINITMNANHTLQAVFQQITFYLDIPTPSGGDVTPNPSYYPIGTSVTLTATPHTGYYFDHWIVDGVNNTSNPLTITMNANHTVQAVFTLIQYTVTIATSTGGTTSPSVGQHQYAQGTIISLAGIPNTNYVFTSWNINGATVTANPYDVTVDQNYTIQATFTYVPPQVQFTLTISSTSGGSTNPSGARLYNEGTDVVVVATPATGYYLDHWLQDGVDVGNANPYVITMNANHTLQAVFALIPKWTLTVTGGIPASATGYAGDSVTVTAQIPQGYKFKEWILDGTTTYIDNPLTLTIIDTVSHTLVANFELIPTTITLTVTADIGGTVAPSGQLTLTIGQAYQFTETEQVGYNFDYWDLAGESKGSSPSIILTVTALMDGQTLTAHFVTEPPERITMTIAVQGNGTTDIAPGQQQFNVGTTVIISAIPQAEAIFINWKLNGADYSTENPLSLPITSDLNGKTLTAYFALFQRNDLPLWIAVIGIGGVIGTYALTGRKKKGRKRRR